MKMLATLVPLALVCWHAQPLPPHRTWAILSGLPCCVAPICPAPAHCCPPPPDQVDALLMARSQPVSLLTGAAGCGKTLVTRAIVKLWKRQSKRVLMCAPTGRAAQRLQEVVEDPDLTATTVHRLLGYKRERSKDEIKAQRDAASGAGQEPGGGSGGAEGGEQVAVVTASANNSQMDLLDVNAFEFGPDNRLQADAGVWTSRQRIPHTSAGIGR